MNVLPKPITDLIEALASLPGVGPKSASRLAFNLLRRDSHELEQFGDRIKNLKSQIVTCRTCHNIASHDPCDFCQDSTRQRDVICIVEDALDVVAIEKSGQFKGRYHVLQGVLSPIEGIGPDQIKLKELEQRLKSEPIKELIIATNPTVEGEATALFISRFAKKYGDIIMTRLAHGLPIGADLEYADEITLSRALENRQRLKQS